MGHNQSTQTKEEQGPDPCTDYLGDRAYLDHMIPHHQVAIDMSLEVMKHTTNPFIKEIANRIVWQQTLENGVMGWHSHTASDEGTALGIVPDRFDITPMERYVPNLSSPEPGYKCDPLFFDPEAHHKKHGMHGHMSDEAFLHHMIPHHQVAVDMSKRLLAHSDNPMLRDIANKIIRDQQGEIYTMNLMLADPERLNSSYPSM
jgi:uncharacterized protein (DUF305 family)